MHWLWGKVLLFTFIYSKASLSLFKEILETMDNVLRKAVQSCAVFLIIDKNGILTNSARKYYSH